MSLRSIDLFQLTKIPETTEIIDFCKLRFSEAAKIHWIEVLYKGILIPLSETKIFKNE